MNMTAYKRSYLDPAECTDLIFGVGSATSAGPTLPSGSIQPSPETLKKDNGGYSLDHPIVGFAHAYISGSGGRPCYGNYLLSPALGQIELDNAKRASFAAEGTERAKCYEYSTTLRNGIRTRSTPAHNAAIHEFTFPKGQDGYFLLDAGRKLRLDESMIAGSVTLDPEKKQIYGGGRYTGNWSKIDWDMYFALEFDGDFSEMGTFLGDAVTPCNEKSTLSISEPQRIGAYVRLGDNTEERTVRVKIAISFVSAEKAQTLLAEQIPEFDYDSVRDAAKEKWTETLSVIELKTDDQALLRRFYTALYHLNVQPRDRTNDHGFWDDFHTVWDTWKTAFPLYSLIYADRMGAIIDSFIDRAKFNEAKNNGLVLTDEYVSATEFAPGQGGNDTDNVIVDAYLKGVPLRKYTWEDAYKVLISSAEKMRSKEYNESGVATSNAKTVSGQDYSYRFKPAAVTMGFAVNDKAVANMAKAMGKSEDHEKYEKRAANFLNTWNPDCESEGFYGFPQKRNEEGLFDEGFDAHGGYNTDFYEATAWDAAYINYNDTPRLIEAMGGRETFISRLIWACEHSVNYYNNDHGREGYLNFTNEPSFHIPWLFCIDEVKRPDLAAKVIDGVIKRFSAADDYPGDEDNGGMSSLYIFLLSGFFPFATTENYYLHGTRLKEIVFHLHNGNDLTVTGENVGEGNIYVQSATFRGKPLNVCKLTHAQLSKGGELHFVMGDQPSDWARE